LSQKKKVISFSLWGSQPVYIVGAVHNAALAKEIYPGWHCRFYVSNDVPPATLERLAKFEHVEIIGMDEPGSWMGLFWRFYALDDDDVGVVIFRDTDSRLNKREKAAVDEWLASDKSFHIIRDSPLQHAAINGGVWGARAKIPGGLRRHMILYLEQDNPRTRGYSSDQHFLGEIIYPIIAPDAMVHDEFLEGNPFPVTNDDGQFVGEKIDASGAPDPIARAFILECRARPSHSLAVYYLRYGNLLKNASERQQEALTCFRKAIALEERLIPAYINLGNVLHRMGRTSEAEQAYREALARDPKTAEGYANLGAIQINRGQLKKAERLIQKALQLKPDYAPALQNLVYLREIKQDMRGALEPLKRLLQSKPDNAEYLHRLATLASRGEDWETAYDTYTRLLSMQPDSLSVFSLWFAARLRLCDWDNYDSLIDEIVQKNRANLEKGGEPSTSLMDLNTMPVPLDLHTGIAGRLAASIQREVDSDAGNVSRVRKITPSGELRIGYFSPDLRNHAVGRLIHPLFRKHKRPDFRIFGYSLVRTGDGVQKTIESGCDVFRDFSQTASAQAARQIRDDGIDVLIDLAGYTTHARPDILARRPAPVQCMLMGFPDTMGGGICDYVLADDWLIPESLEPYYAEQVYRLPHAFFGAPTNVSERRMSRSEFGLPDEAIVFLCNANNAHHKISPALFDAWMTLLSRVAGGVLWISGGCERTQLNLRERASTRDVDPERVLFAPRLPWERYLQRMQLADLALDTFYYNGGSSSIATISAGVPLLTCAGETNASRMGASICAAAGLDSLITHSLDSYVERAVELVTEGGELREIRGSLQDPNKLPLFDLAQIAKDIEAAAVRLVGQ